MASRARALAIGVRDVIRREFPLRDEQCETRQKGDPPANSGQLYIAVFSAGLAPGPSGDQVLGVDEVHSVSVGITQRTGIVPDDRMFEEALYLDDEKQIGAYTAFQRIHRIFRTRVRYTMLNDINVQMSEDGIQGVYLEPLALASDTYEFVEKDPDWWKACWESEEEWSELMCQYSGIYVEMTLTGARYWESLLAV